MKIDINSDVGESFGIYTLGNDAALMPYITSANIACGFHAGDPFVMKRTVALALKHYVKIGAHPGFDDLAGFGRKTMNISPAEVGPLMHYQIGALYGIVRAQGGELHHVKPHGALYNMAVKSDVLAEAVVVAVKAFNPALFLYGLPNSALERAAHKYDLPFKAEIYADRNLTDEGMLVPRDASNAMIHDVDVSAEQIMRVIEEGCALSVHGKCIPMRGETVCVHGDNPAAVTFAKTLYARLK
ncbi:5-oxoprolinase subunit PxpA [Fusibacter paucivorans]|uniref:5-oxoprolinase subunit PxpA n=1 Tax=Fusibacter paucivorans TaxID=76009 RepID=A0ABS5PKB6_9FIRM|nr:5-oxoprolinase subunit PxpA [Fusibacter paucivorans]MBS7525446.1 5-oxoprolinase subunit PxpA [Fusibacter paucivorans]